MIPVVVFSDSYDYQQYMFSDFLYRNNTVVIEAYPFRVGGIKYRTWNVARRMTRRKENFPRFWLQNQLNCSGISRRKPAAFCIVNTALQYYNDEFVGWLRKTYQGSRIYLLCLDSIALDYGVKTLSRTCIFDAVYSFDKGDCIRFGWRHFWGLMPTIDKSWFDYSPAIDHEDTSDICFIGGDRGRYLELKKLYLRLTADGMRCLFKVKTDRKVEDEVDKKLIIHESIPFREVLRMEGSAQILLDYGFISTGEVGFTLRVMDAVGFGRGIITTNRYMKDCPLCFSEKVGMVDSLDEISPELIRKIEKHENEPYTCINIFSADKIIEDMIQEF